jgi:membrane associated rhomboid family serine protease
MGVTPPLPTDASPGKSAVELPVWARPEAFPEAPRNAPWGWMDRKGRAYGCADAAALNDAVAKDREGAIDLAWSPASRHLVVPEEIPEIAGALLKQRERNVRMDFEDSLRRFGFLTLAIGAFAIYQFYTGWTRLPPGGLIEKSWFVLRLMKFSSSLGLGVIGWLVFGFIPFYQAWKRRRELGGWTSGRIATLAPVYRFETWLAVQRAPFAMALLGVIGVVYFFQWLSPNDIEAAGLVKSAYAQGEWWRLFTAPFLHGFLPHLLMNGAAMWYLGRRIEVLARWPHLPMVFLFAAWMGGEFSARMVETPSVGASGGIMGWLGFLLVFETLHGQLVPRKSRRRLLAGVLLTGLIGLIGYRFIDNAAHAGGLLAGMLYAWIVFPKSNSPLRPRTNATDWIAGTLASMVLVAAAGFAVWRLALDWLSSR